MRIRLLRSAACILFLSLTLSLAYHQLVKGTYYFQLSQNNRIKLLRLAPARGTIYDRQGRVLAGKGLCFNVAIFAQEADDLQQIFDNLSPVLGIQQEQLKRQFQKDFFAPFIPVVIARDIPKKTAITLECRESDIPGLDIQTEPLRDYRYGESAGHILGYLGRVNEDELRESQDPDLWVKDLVGRSGLEQRFDRYLRGQAGGMQVEVNNRGHKVNVLGSRAAQAGTDLYLTVDAELQEFVHNLLEERTGACIVMDPQNGAILALVSKPGFDPNLFIAAVNGKPGAGRRVGELLNSSEAALLNRATCGLYSPGSIFKIVVAAAGLETHKISAQTMFECRGAHQVGNRQFLCWNLDGHGKEDITSGLAHSCNVFFYKLGLLLGPDKLSLFARKFGLGSPTGIDLPYEAKGLVPSKSWKFKTYKENWYDGETANYSIGQGYLSVTPLQIAQLVSAIANGGYLVRPHLVKRIGPEQTRVVREKLNLKKETLAIVAEGMRQVVQDEQGTGYNANIPGVEWAAKTGTTQTSSGLAHGWFGGFYPFDQPRIALLVFLEYGGSGGDVPAKTAKRIIEYIHENEM